MSRRSFSRRRREHPERGAARPGPNHAHRSARPAHVAATPTLEPTAPVSGAPSELAEPLAVVPVTPADRNGDLMGGKRYRVEPGDCLWSIASAFLPAGVSNAEVAAGSAASGG